MFQSQPLGFVAMPFDGVIDDVRSQISGLAGSCEGIDILLKQIEETAVALGQRTNLAMSLTVLNRATTKLIQKLKIGGILDADGSFGTRFQACADTIADSIADFAARKATIDEDGRLDALEDKRTHLHECYDRLLDSWAILRKSILELRQSIIDYDNQVPAAEYPEDDGPLSDDHLRLLKSREPQGRMVVTRSLLG